MCCRIEEQPDFLPMVPWYSGTSADMYKTVFDLLISVKLFLGRFDMRTMQVRLGSFQHVHQSWIWLSGLSPLAFAHSV